jgi:hypothetical protein
LVGSGRRWAAIAILETNNISDGRKSRGEAEQAQADLARVSRVTTLRN